METELELYAAAFPFPRAEERRIASIEEWLGVELAPCLRLLFSKIGEGNYFLTGEYFIVDDAGSATHTLLKSIGTLGDPDYAEQVARVPDNYETAGKELVIGDCDAGTYFVEDAGAVAPIVRCWMHGVGVVADKCALSSIVPKFRYFNRPRDIPQSIVDYEWFSRHFGFELNADLHHQNIKRWVKNGRPGMPIHYLDHTCDEYHWHEEELCLFDPGYFLW